MFRSLMTIIRELYLYLTHFMFMLKHIVNLRLYIHKVMWQHVVEWHVCCVQCRMRLKSNAARVSFCATHNTHHAATSPYTYNNIVLMSVLT